VVRFATHFESRTRSPENCKEEGDDGAGNSHVKFLLQLSFLRSRFFLPLLCGKSLSMRPTSTAALTLCEALNDRATQRTPRIGAHQHAGTLVAQTFMRTRHTDHARFFPNAHHAQIAVILICSVNRGSRMPRHTEEHNLSLLRKVANGPKSTNQ